MDGATRKTVKMGDNYYSPTKLTVAKNTTVTWRWPGYEEAGAVVYHDFKIIPKPIPQGGQFLTAGTIVKDFPDGRREHRFVRADTHGSEEEARKFMLQKAQRLIDEVGDRLFKS